MKGIRFKLLSSFLAIVAIFIIAEVFSIVVDSNAINRYKGITDNMISEYSLIGATSDLINSFNNVTKYVTDSKQINAFNATHSTLENLLATLNVTIVDANSRVAYLGLKNTITAVVADVDSGMAAIKDGNYAELTTFYNSANAKNVFVQQNTVTLLLRQMEYSKNLQTEIENFQYLTRLIALILFVLVSLICIWYVIVFSKKLVRPLAQLTKLAKTVESGDFNVAVSKNLLVGKDEVASLANSFDKMIFSIRNNIKKLQEYNAQLIAAKQEVVSKEVTITQLKELDKLKNEVLNIATHELKTPLISIVGLSEVMEKKNESLPPEYREFISIIHKEGLKLTSLIKSMLEASRNEQGKTLIAKTKFKIDELILSMDTSLSVIVKRTDSQVAFKIGVKGVELNSDKEKISQVIYNFVDNAVKYGDPKQTIELSLTQPDLRSVKISVKNSGQGVSPEMQKKLFLKFSQLEPSLSRSQDGIGLGLYISKQNIESLGGQIGMLSVPGQGATFYFTLPIK